MCYNILHMKTQKIVFTLLRYVMSFIFLWAFIDKAFGLGFATKSSGAWINGGSPTTGFLANAVKGPFADFFHGLSGMVAVDWLFMASLLFIGLTLLFNRYVKFGVCVGSVLMALMYTSLMLPENNPIIDEHIVYILVLILLGSRVEGWRR